MARPKGSLNKKNLETIKAVEATGLTPLAYMLSVMQDADKPEAIRIDAAKSAAPYVHAKLASVEMSGKGGGPIAIQMAAIDEDA